SRMPWRRLTIILTGAVLALAPTGCAYRGLSMSVPAAAFEPGKPAVVLSGNGALAPAGSPAAALTYNPDLAPVGAAMTGLLSSSPEGSTSAELIVSGLRPDRGYAAHVHTKACGAKPEDSGPHFQNHPDPAATPQSPSSDPRYANPSNEIWLDLRTDAAGAGTSRAVVPFALTDRIPGSIVLHEAMQTATGPGQAGKAGARVACLTLTRK
ncbi:MAG TPA: hypothetical protein VFO16_06400, partial [Pseudonocardiaceae bacterium]|nr:hypothetical protein [Pseudonocardiaceae bacterium]